MKAANKMVLVPLDMVDKSDYRHPPFGPAYRPFLERLSHVFADVFPDSPEAWEDDFRRDTHPESEMAFWADMARLYEHFTQGKAWSLGRKKELFGVLMACLSGDPKLALQQNLRHLARPQVRAIVNHVRRATGEPG